MMDDLSCTIAYAEDGDVAFFVSASDFADGEPCGIELGDTVKIWQGGYCLGMAPFVPAASLERIGNARGLCVVNIRDAGTDGEILGVNRHVLILR